MLPRACYLHPTADKHSHVPHNHPYIGVDTHKSYSVETSIFGVPEGLVVPQKLPLGPIAEFCYTLLKSGLLFSPSPFLERAKQWSLYVAPLPSFKSHNKKKLQMFHNHAKSSTWSLKKQVNAEQQKACKLAKGKLPEGIPKKLLTRKANEWCVWEENYRVATDQPCLCYNRIITIKVTVIPRSV